MHLMFFATNRLVCLKFRLFHYFYDEVDMDTTRITRPQCVEDFIRDSRKGQCLPWVSIRIYKGAFAQCRSSVEVQEVTKRIQEITVRTDFPLIQTCTEDFIG